jgi:hypothetical protein
MCQQQRVAAPATQQHMCAMPFEANHSQQCSQLVQEPDSDWVELDVAY